MDCKQSKKFIEELALSGGTAASQPEFAAHLGQCPECLAQWEGMQRTLSLLDQWQAPEPSPFFGTRLQARLQEIRREEAAAGWRFRWPLSRLRTAMVAGALCLAVAAGIFVEQQQDTPDHTVSVTAPKGTAVNDLQMLEKNQDVYSSYDLLDDIGGGSHHSTSDKSL